MEGPELRGGPIWEKVGDNEKINMDGPDKFYCFPKKKQVGKDNAGDPVYQKLDPPRFYETLKRAAEYNKSVRESGAPEHKDEDRPQW